MTSSKVKSSCQPMSLLIHQEPHKQSYCLFPMHSQVVTPPVVNNKENPDGVEKLKRENFIYYNSPTVDAEIRKRNEQSLLRQVISQLRIGMDLTSLSCPSFILRPKSFLEIVADSSAPTEHLFLASTTDSRSINSSHSLTSPQQRILNVARWIVLSMTVAPSNNLSGMKPYNPILGEQFHCHWRHNDNSTTVFTSEQTSHHPPISSCFMFNEKHGFSFESTALPKATFYGNSVETVIHGQNVLTLHNWDNEQYEIDLPSIVARGIIWGSGSVEHGKTLVITCKRNQLTIKLDVKPGNSIEGYLSMEQVEQGYFFSGKRSIKLAKIWGNVLDCLYIQYESSQAVEVFLDCKSVNIPRKQVREVYDQAEHESRRVWHHVSHAIFMNDFETASRFKHELEERERFIRKQREMNQIEWNPVLFEHVGELSSYRMPLFKIRRTM